MTIAATIPMALRALSRNRMRSALTALGIIIGVGTIVAMVAIGDGARVQVAAQVASLGENIVMVYPGSTSSSITGVRLGWGSAPVLSIADSLAIQNEVSGIAAVSPELYAYGQIAAGNQNWNTKLYGESPSFFEIRQWPLAEGEAFGDQDVSGAGQVAVVGQTTAQKLFGDESPVGQTVRVLNVPFKIIGLLTPKGFSVKGHDQDNVLIVPYTSAMQRLVGSNAALYAINVKARDRSQVEYVRAEIADLLRQRHRIEPGRDDDFVVKTQLEIAEAATETARVMTVMLAALASVSLLVGGIGIMNIMLVSVTERTREIGIRRAVGARAGDIRRQFLVEALALSTLGGLCGIALGTGASQALTALARWPAVISAGSMLAAFSFSAAVGVFFGLYPASRASRLDPVDSLRYE